MAEAVFILNSRRSTLSMLVFAWNCICIKTCPANAGDGNFGGTFYLCYVATGMEWRVLRLQPLIWEGCNLLSWHSRVTLLNIWIFNGDRMGHDLKVNHFLRLSKHQTGKHFNQGFKVCWAKSSQLSSRKVLIFSSQAKVQTLESPNIFFPVTSRGLL